MNKTQLNKIIREELNRVLSEKKITEKKEKKEPKLGSGKRFKNLEKKIASQKEGVDMTADASATEAPTTSPSMDELKQAIRAEVVNFVKEASASHNLSSHKVKLETFRNFLRKEVASYLKENGITFKNEKANNPAAIAASIGREKYGKDKFQQMAAAGRKRHSK